MFDDDNGKVSMTQVAVALFDVRPHEWSHMRSPPPTPSHLIIFILMISIITIHRFIVMSSFQITQCVTLSLQAKYRNEKFFGYVEKKSESNIDNGLKDIVGFVVGVLEVPLE